MKNVTIIGGGTAGWISAMFISTEIDNVSVTLVESKSIGIVGVGEGTTPNIKSFLKSLGISESDFMKKTEATKKIGIAFENWPGDESSFNHDFYNNNYAYHFDTHTIGNYFKDIGLTRNITHIEDDVVGFDKDGDVIKTIHLENNDSINTDFVIDCSGFSKLVVGNELNGEWTSHKDHLTLNSAIPFHLPLDGEVFTSDSDTRTRAITMKHGWMWMIPLQNRWGCGYVFDDKYIDVDSAKEEVNEYFNKEITFSKKIQFESGYFKDVWVGNSIALGLAGGFFEPLEATSIMTLIYQLEQLRAGHLNLEDRDRYNLFVRRFNEQIYHFIKYHYVCDRNDTEFWQDYKSHTLPEKLTKLLDKDNRLRIFDKDKLREVLEIPSNDTMTVFDSYAYSLVSGGNFKKDKKLF